LEIHQILVGAAYGDAITNEAFRLRRLLRAVCPSEIFAVYIDPRLPDVHQLRHYRGSTDGNDLMIVYLSIGEEHLFRFVNARSEQIVLRYHSMTPAEEVEPYDPEYAKRLEKGREQVAALAGRTSLGLAGSHFGEAELVADGFGRTATCPLLVSADTLHSLTPQTPTALGQIDGPLVLSVGRVVPNKAVEEVLVAFHVLKTYQLPKASLVLVGGRQFPAYDSMLDALVGDLGLLNVHFLGGVTAAELAALYLRADALICLSRHEGFCAPLVEAMSFDVPVVAVDSTAVGETLGGAGCLLDDRSPSLVAEALFSVITDDRLRQRLITAGRRRLNDFAPDTVGAQWLRHLSSVA
jgi:glycosyltransferase involved in cell wall biosynthesis